MYKLLSLFTGAGGLDYGFEKTSRFSVRYAIEMQAEFCETLRWNQPKGYLRKASILQKDLTEIKPVVDLLNGYRPDGIIGGPPCETFTSMGKMEGRKDPRGNLVFKFADWVNWLDPSFFVMENVPLLKTIEGGELFRDLLLKFRKNSYNINIETLNAADYGAPTRRKRLFIVGMKSTEGFLFPEATHYDPRKIDLFGSGKSFRTVREAIGDLPSPTINGPDSPQSHIMIKHTEKVRNRFSKLKLGELDPIRKRVRLDWDSQSPSLIAGNLNGIRSHIHPSEPRELTNRESARIQGFPDDFHFAGNHAAVGKQIANSVPIALGCAIAQAVYKQLKSSENSK